MATFLLDTTTLSHLRNHHLQVEANYTLHSDPIYNHILGVGSINVEEVMSGWLNYIQRARTPSDEANGSRYINEAVRLLARFELYAVTEAAVLRYETLRRMKLNVGRNDLRLAALALELGATVVTDNARDFKRVPGLLWVDWTQ